MTDCRDCRFAKWDYEDYYNCPYPQWFVCGCIKDMDAFENEGYECEEMTDEMWDLIQKGENHDGT